MSTAPFALAAYLARIGLAAPPRPDAAGLALLQRAHRLAIPFENLDVILGRAIAIDGAAVFAKLVTKRRGGYCFEHNRLFGDALAALGFAARPLLGRVWLDMDDPPPRTHALSLVTIDGRDWIADAGFGGSYAPPMPLIDGATADAPDGARFRLNHDRVRGWTLECRGNAAATDGRGAGPGFQPQYSLSLDAVSPADLAESNHWISTAPESRFRRHRIASLVLPNGFATLTDRAYRRYNGDGGAAGEVDDPRVYRLRLSLLFGIDLSVDEVAALGLFGGPAPG